MLRRVMSPIQMRQTVYENMHKYMSACLDSCLNPGTKMVFKACEMRHYRCSVVTGNLRGAGTDSRIFITITGDGGKSKHMSKHMPRHMSKRMSKHVPEFMH